MKRYQSALDILKLIYQVQYATIRNLYSRSSVSIQAGNRHIRRLLKQELIKPIRPIPWTREVKKFTFYQLTDKGAKALDVDTPKIIETKSRIEHESMKVDIALSFIYGYPDYVVDIEYPLKGFPLRPNNRKNASKEIEYYKPDMIVRMFNRKDTSDYYAFIVEIEKSREVHKVISEKIPKIRRMEKFYKYSLPGGTIFLFVWTTNYFRVLDLPKFWPTKDIEAVDKFFKGFFRKDIPSYIYFLKYHDFPYLHEAVWHTGQGNKISLIN